jgi:BRCA1-associated protein
LPRTVNLLFPIVCLAQATSDREAERPALATRSTQLFVIDQPLLESRDPERISPPGAAMTEYSYHIKFELYPTPDPTGQQTKHNTNNGIGASGSGSGSNVPVVADNNIWIPAPGASIFDDLPSHPRQQGRTDIIGNNTTGGSARSSWGEQWSAAAKYDRHDALTRTYEEAAAAAARAANSRVIDCGSRRAGTGGEDIESGGGRGERDWWEWEQRGLRNRQQQQQQQQQQVAIRTKRGETSPPRTTADGIGPEQAVRDWRFGRVRIESFDLKEAPRVSGQDGMAGQQQQQQQQAGDGGAQPATPAASLGPNLGGMGLATKARYVPLETKNTEAGWGIVHLYREGDETAAGGVVATEDGGSSGEDGTILCILAVPSYMSPSDFLGFVGEKWRGHVSHYRMVMTSRMSRYMVLMKFRDAAMAREWRKEFDGKPFDSVEVSLFWHFSMERTRS